MPAAELPIFLPSCRVRERDVIDDQRDDDPKTDSTKKPSTNDQRGNEILTLQEVAERLRCSKAHASKLLRGEVLGVPALTHVAMGRRKVVRSRWLDAWLDACGGVNIFPKSGFVATDAGKRKSNAS